MTIIFVAAFIGLANLFLKRKGNWFIENRFRILREIAGMTAITLWLLTALFLAASAWAVAFMLLGIFANAEEALYFSLVSFTTLGFGDVVIEDRWRMLSTFVAANGLILFSLVTAYLIAAVRGILGRL